MPTRITIAVVAVVAGMYWLFS